MSQVQQYEECGWRYYLARVERVTPRPAAWSFHGSAFHAVAEAVVLSNGRMTAEEAVEAFSDKYARLVQDALDIEPDTDRWLSSGRYSGGEEIERRYVLGQEQTAQYVDWVAEHRPEVWTTPAGKPAVELGFTVELGGVVVRGIIDLLVMEADGDAVRVRDLKTGSIKSRFQLETYAVAIESLYDVPVRRGDWYLAKDGRLSRPVALDQVSPAEVGERYATMDAGVKAGRFEANPGYGCRFCDVSHGCFFYATS
ncbi:Gene 69 protein [Streptantibioticus cattleyicolor NRRL 8057 = DSM 46488]|nr:Gene 69 protein [Streptantibioticus cattleyicolor NRRL 8057 = DSM 46488]